MARKAPATTPTNPPAATNGGHSIPAAVRGGGDVLDDFDSLGSDGATTVKTPGKKGSRPEVPLPPQVEDEFKRWAWAKVLAEIVEKRAENSAAEVKREIFALWQEALWKNKAQPVNPALKANNADGQPDVEGLFQVQDKFTKNNCHVPEPAEGETLQQATLRLLVEQGVPEASARDFLDNEVEMRPVKSVRSINELLFGRVEEGEWRDSTDAEKAVAQKVIEFVKSLPPEERKLALVTTPQVTVKKGVINRLPLYAKALDHLKAILRVFTPVYFVGKAKVGISDTPAERVERLADYAKEVIGSSDPDVRK